MGKLTDIQVAMLKETLLPENVSKRQQSGRDISYVEGHYCLTTANNIFGFGGWSYEIVGGLDGVRTEMSGQIQLKDSTGKVTGYAPGYISRAVVKVSVMLDDGTWMSRTDIGLCTPSVSIKQGFTMPSPDAIDTAEKGAVTDALKRALRSFGDQFGNSLYDKTNDIHKQPQGTSDSSDAELDDTKKCPNCKGSMSHKHGEKNGRRWSGFFCNSKNPNCKPIFDSN